jgi:lipopolysaccharide biosynthesis protein/ubiquinone/menaquinone biosynthesis C-methylase UbiE
MGADFLNRTAFRFPQPVNALRFDGERYVSGLLGNATSGDIQSEHYHRYLFALRFCSGKDVLDIASGEGYGSHCLGQVARSVIGVDANDEAVEFANRNYLTDRVSFKVGRAQAIPIADTSIDVVVSFETLEHFAEHDAFATEVRRVLRPGGLLVISSPNRVVYSEQANYHNEWHVRELDRDEFFGFLADNFANVGLFAQRPMIGSVIAGDDERGNGQLEGFILRGEGIFRQTDGVPFPPFFVALASDAQLPEAPSSVLHNPGLLLHIDAQRQAAEALVGESSARLTRLEAALEKAAKELSEAEQVIHKARGERDTAAQAAKTKDGLVRNLLFDLDRVAQSAAEGQAAIRELEAIQVSTLWRVTSPLRRALNAFPPSFRRTLRNTARLLWWILTLRLSNLRRSVRRPRRHVPESGIIGAAPDMFSVRMHEPRGRIAVVVHLHYPELWPELHDALSSISERFDLFVSVTQGAAEAAIGQIYSDFPNAQIVVFQNHGRDILPFLTFAETGVLNRYDLICKLHGKRTIHRQDGDDWRRRLLGGVLRDRDHVQRIIGAFEADPDLGIVVADGQVFGGRPEHWVDNRVRVLEIGARIGLEHLSEGTTFPGGSIFWIRPFLLRTLTGLKLTAADFEPEPLARDGSTAHAVERLVGVVCADAGMWIAESGALPSTPPSAMRGNVRVVAYYLPQYHPTPENDAWWGAGFTEWTNVTRTRPLFRHHRQPRLPADLGFYDLRVPETREAQADLAERYGVNGFCYYYYWFNGRGMLRRPLEEMVSSGRPAFPFMICWANEPWSRNWDGGNRELLLPQDYTPGWARTFARDIAPLLADPRYIRVDGCPMLLIYRTMHIPDRMEAMIELREEVRRLGLGEVHISGGWVGFPGDDEPPENPAASGLDSWFEFPPHRLVATQITDAVADLNPAYSGQVYSYRSAVDISIAALDIAKPYTHRAVMAGWDNTPRRKLDGNAFFGATPALLRRWLRAVVCAEAARTESGERTVFVNAWNEWAEGTYLEPDSDFGLGWLEAVASATGRDMTRRPVFEMEPDVTPVLARAVAAKESIDISSSSMNDAEWVELMIRSAEAQHAEGMVLPAFPALCWQSMFVGSSGAHAMREAAAFQVLVKQELAALGRPLLANDRVLDFGCGWGRFIRLWMKDVSPANLFGVDVDPDMIGFCRISGLPAQFAIVPPLGPTAFEADSLDLIYAYSVFSHLSEAAHVAWMEEFYRILKPGGILIFTTQARRFLSWTETLREEPADALSDWELSLRTAFPEVGRALADHDAGRFVFTPTGGGEHRPASFYGEASIPEAWLSARWGDKGFAIRAFIDDPNRCPQAVAVMQRKPLVSEVTDGPPHRESDRTSC